MIKIQDSTTPTLADVKALLEAGTLAEVANTFAVAELGHQYFAILPAVDRWLGEIQRKGLGDLQPELVIGHRLLELGGFFTAERLSLASEQVGFTAAQALQRKVLIAARDVAVRLASSAGADERLFSVNFGQGEASNVLAPARVFLALLDKHGDKLGVPTLLGELRAEVKAAIDALTAAEIGQETRKRDQLVPGGQGRRIRHALYALLLRWSRLGFAVASHQPDDQALFSLGVLRRDRSAPRAVVADDDDAPLLPVASAGAGVEVPAGAVASLDGGATPG